MSDIPQIDPNDPQAEEKARAVCRVATWRLEEFENYNKWPHTHLPPKWVKVWTWGYITNLGSGETIIQAVNVALSWHFDGLLPNTQTRIRAICARKEAEDERSHRRSRV